PRAFIVQFTCFSCFFSKLIIHESSKPGNHYGRPVLLLLGLNATAPFLRKTAFSHAAVRPFRQKSRSAHLLG
ncbi:MAG: hypothetical protein PUC03_04350, partial [Clostridiales bacterium]|nr:hypothetical protein [Clostridiales bacterium]